MKSKFITELYKLSNRPKRLDFFDKIKDVCESWVDDVLENHEYSLRLCENEDQYDGHWIEITLTDDIRKEISDEELEEWDKLFNKFEYNFNKNGGDRKRLFLDGDGNIMINNRI